jgi:hypothetical protein
MFLDDVRLDIDALRAYGNAPRVHPNGFIQLDLVDRLRLHVWSDRPLRARGKSASVHDHVYGFTSDVRLGTLVHREIRLYEHPEGEYELYAVESYAVAGRSMPLRPIDGKRHKIVSTVERRLVAPVRYAFPAFAFHEAWAVGLTATVIAIDEPDRTRAARVLRPFGQPPVAEVFERDGGTGERDMLWDVIDRVCREAR